MCHFWVWSVYHIWNSVFVASHLLRPEVVFAIARHDAEQAESYTGALVEAHVPQRVLY